MNRVVITGLGCVTPIGNTVAEFTTNLFAGNSGIAPFTSLIPTPPTDEPGLRFRHMAEGPRLRPRRAPDLRNDCGDRTLGAVRHRRRAPGGRGG